MKSRVVKRSVFLAGHRTSLSLEEEFYHGLSEIAAGRHLRVNELIHEIGTNRQSGTLSSALRLFVLEYYRSQSRTNAGMNSTRAEAGPSSAAPPEVR